MWVTLKLEVVGLISTNKCRKSFWKLCKLELQIDIIKDKMSKLEKQLMEKESELSSTHILYSTLKTKGK